jgi:hypothetical protein
MTDITSTQIIENLGEKRLISELGFTERNLRHIRRQGKFPGSWYYPLKNLCDAHGVYCPVTAFVWKGHDKNHGNPSPRVQDLGDQSTTEASQ